MKTYKHYLENNPPLVLLLGFFILILIGSFLLALPISQQAPDVTYLDCLFTSTSAVCVTGLVTVPTFSAWTTFGKVIIISLIQVGGLGFMTFASLLALVLRRKISLKNRLIIKEQTNSLTMSGLVRLIQHILVYTFMIEFVGAILLMFRFIPMYGAKGIAYGIFHSISAFCNAGFDLIGANSLIDVNTDTFLLTVIGVLIILGGLGFTVMTDLMENHFHFRKLSLHSKIVMTTTELLLGLTTLLIFVLEYHNPETLASLSVGDKLSNAFFQASTLRTAGFQSISQTALLDSSSALSVFNMFVGASPAGTGGGIKTTTFALLIIVALSEIKGNEEIEVFHRRLRWTTVKKAIALMMISLVWVLLVTFIILMVENARYLDVIYEVVSAFATVGLSRNFTSSLSAISKLLIILTMYIGRVGSLTILFGLSSNKHPKEYKEAHEDIMIG